MEKRVLYQGKWLRLCTKTVISRSGKEAQWEFVERVSSSGESDGVDLIADYKGCLVVIACFRYPVGSYVLEFPAGLTEGKSVVETALKELKEETGYKASESDIREISPIVYTDPWKSTESIRYVQISVPECLENEHPVQELEGEEDIIVKLVPINGLLDNLLAIASAENYEIDARLYLFAKGLQDSCNVKADNE